MPDDIFTVKQEPFKIPPPPSADLLKTDVNAPPVPDLSKQIASARQSPEKVRDIQAQNLERIAQNQRAISQTQLAQEQYGAQAEADIAKQEREKVQNIEQQYQDFRSKWPLPELHPTKDNIQTLTGLFSLIGVVGAAMGGQGRMSAIGALQSMSGMMEGWQKGRADLWKKEKDEFEANFKRIKAILDDAKSDADRAMKLMAYDTKEAQAAAKQAAVKLGSQVANQILENQGLEKFNAYLNGVVKDYQHLEVIREQRAAREQAHKDALAAKEEARKEKEEGGYVPSSTAQDHIRSNLNILSDMQYLKDKMQDPKFRAILNQPNIRTQLIISDDMPKLSQILSSNLPTEVKEFAVTLKRLRNNYYLDQSGKAVTGSEAARNYGVAAQPGDSAEDLAIKLDVGIRNATNVAQQHKRVYTKFYDRLTGGQGPVSQTAIELPKTNEKGYVLHIDKNGVKAYVNPNNPNDFEVIQ
jgi:hypothetical protein